VATADDGTNEGLPVIIENQYGHTDRAHLGKLITDLASLPFTSSPRPSRCCPVARPKVVAPRSRSRMRSWVSPGLLDCSRRVTGNGATMAGESAQREYERIRDRRCEERRQRLPLLVALTVVVVVGIYAFFEWYMDAGYLGVLVGLLLVLPRALVPSQREVAWRRGAEGERIVGRALEALEVNGLLALHDRRIPPRRENLDHVVVGRNAVYTVDAKRYKGRIAVRGQRLFVAGRDRPKLVAQARRQRGAVRAALDAGGFQDVPVLPVLCFTGVEWPLLFPPRRAGDVRLCSPKGLRRALDAGTPQLPSSQQRSILDHLARVLVPVTGPPPARSDRPQGSAPSSSALTRGEDNAEPAEHELAAGAPACSRCGAAMVERRRRRDGERFLGCSTFPTCRYTQPHPGEA
jgi:hypothetical protein